MKDGTHQKATIPYKQGSWPDRDSLIRGVSSRMKGGWGWMSVWRRIEEEEEEEEDKQKEKTGDVTSLNYAVR